jgi:hypothetical protein
MALTIAAVKAPPLRASSQAASVSTVSPLWVIASTRGFGVTMGER